MEIYIPIHIIAATPIIAIIIPFIIRKINIYRNSHRKEEV